MNEPERWPKLGVLSLLLGGSLLLAGSTIGLIGAPAERHMGEVSRILYVHLPAAWNCLLFYTVAMAFAVATLWSGALRHEALMVAALEVGLVLNVVLLATGSLFARPTWGVWWDWDVRLTTSLLAVLLFAGVLTLRAFVADPARRATFAAVATIVAWVDVPLIYFCVRWWRSLHQIQSSPETVDRGMVLPLRINAFGVLFLALGTIALTSRTLQLWRREEETAPPARLNPAGATEIGG